MCPGRIAGSNFSLRSWTIIGTEDRAVARQANPPSVHVGIQIPKQEQQHYPIKIAPTRPNIQKPSRIVNLSTTFLLPLVGEWLCMGIVGQRFKVKTKSSHAIPVADCSRFNGMRSSVLLPLTKFTGAI